MSLNISDMGSMQNAMGNGQKPNAQGGGSDTSGDVSDGKTNMPGGKVPGEVSGDGTTMPGGGQIPGGVNNDGTSMPGGQGMGGDGEMPDFQGRDQIPGEVSNTNQQGMNEGLLLLLMSIGTLVVGILFAVFYKRRGNI